MRLYQYRLFAKFKKSDDPHWNIDRVFEGNYFQYLKDHVINFGEFFEKPVVSLPEVVTDKITTLAYLFNGVLTHSYKVEDGFLQIESFCSDDGKYDIGLSDSDIEDLIANLRLVQLQIREQSSQKENSNA